MTDRPPSVVALIPARGGSVRVPGKNIRRLGPHPLIAYSIASAFEAGIFDAVVVSTDSDEIAGIARHYGADVPFLRPHELAGPTSPDIDWVEYTIGRLAQSGRLFDAFSILRPTSPFRDAAAIVRAWTRLRSVPGADSLRAVERCKQHPGKMWIVRGDRMLPLLPFGPREQPWHSTPYQALPEVYVQNASLEIAWTRLLGTGRTIAGEVVVPFLTDEREGFDINDEGDWWLAEEMLRRNAWRLPPVIRVPFDDAASGVGTDGTAWAR